MFSFGKFMMFAPTLCPVSRGTDAWWLTGVTDRKGEMVTSEVGKEVQKRVWTEIKGILGKEVADLDRYFRP